jgi:hypothetical protein
MQFFLFAATAVVHGKILPVVEAAVVILLVLCVHVATRKLESRQAVGEQ